MTVAATTSRLSRPRFFLRAAALACALVAVSPQAAWSVSCKPGHFRPAFYVKTMGACGFDPATLSFRGEPAEQARCLMRGMDRSRNLGPEMAELPHELAERVGRTDGLPSREALAALLSNDNFEWDFAAYLWMPLSHGGDNDSQAPAARYFVIHDTSGPSFGHRGLPADVDVNRKINNLANFRCPDGWGRAHVVINRTGGMLLTHELSTPWRETKFEQAANFAGALKGLFLHTELIQPRHGRHNAESPNPSFTAVQYDRLALVYVAASVRAGRWLIPAFHAALDSQIHNGHDDPLNFDVEHFAGSLQRLADRLDDVKLAASAAPPRVPWGTIDTTYHAAAEAEAAASPVETPAPVASATREASSTPPPAATTDGVAANAAPAPPLALAAPAASTDGMSTHAIPPPVAREAPAADGANPAQLASTEAAVPGGTAGKIAGKSDGGSEHARELGAASEHCQTHRIRGHRHRSCTADTAEATPERPERPAAKRVHLRARVASNNNPFATLFSHGAAARAHRRESNSGTVRFWPQ